MKITGLDLSMTATGVCLPDGSVTTIRPRGKGDARLKEITDRVHWLALESDLVVLEDVPSAMIGSAGKVVPMLHGAIRLRLIERGLPYMALAPSTLKKFATGNGSADKIKMAVAALKRFGGEFADDNQCDAAWLHWAGRFAYRLENGFTLPKIQVEALFRNTKGLPIEWPALGMYEPRSPQHAPGRAVLCDSCAAEGLTVCV